MERSDQLEFTVEELSLSIYFHIRNNIENLNIKRVLILNYVKIEKANVQLKKAAVFLHIFTFTQINQDFINIIIKFVI